MIKVCYIPSKEKRERQEALEAEKHNATELYSMFNFMAGFQSLKWFIGFMGINATGSSFIFFYIAIVALIIAKALPDKEQGKYDKKGGK